MLHQTILDSYSDSGSDSDINYNDTMLNTE